MLAAKSFDKTADWAKVEKWFGILAEELANRISIDAEEHHRAPRTLAVHYRYAHSCSTKP